MVLESFCGGELLAELGHLVKQDARGLLEECLELAPSLEDALCLFVVDVIGGLEVVVVVALEPRVVGGDWVEE